MGFWKKYLHIQAAESQGLSNNFCPHVHFLLREINVLASLGMNSQHVYSHSPCSLSRVELPLKIISYPDSSGCWVDMDPIDWHKIPPPLAIESVASDKSILK